MARKVFAEHPHKAEALLALREGVPTEEIVRRYGCSEKSAKRWAKQVEDEKKGITDIKVPTGVKAKVSETGGTFAAVVSLKPAPVIFELGEQRIPLDPQLFYESYILYEDLKVKANLSDGFSSVVRDGVALLWQLLVPKPAIEKGKVKTEVH